MADVRLDSVSDESAAQDSYAIVARTCNAPFNVTFSEQAATAKLNATLQTQNAPAQVQLHPAFEGHIRLHASPFSPPNVSEANVEDPAGLGRRRNVVLQNSRWGAMLYSVGWQPPLSTGRREGLVEVQTSNAPMFFSF